MKPKTKTLQSLRISESSLNQINTALKKLNSTSIVLITLADYRRLANLYFARDIMSGKSLNFQLER